MVSIRCVIFRFDLQFYFLRISIQGFIVQTIMFFHDEVSSSGFKDKICRERLPKQKVCDWRIAIIVEDLGAFYLSWFGQIISHNLTPVSWERSPYLNGSPVRRLVKYCNFGARNWWFIPPEVLFFVFVFMFFVVKSHTETERRCF